MHVLRVVRNPSAIVVVSLQFLGIAAPAKSSVTYQYTGNPFSTFSGAYTASDKVTIDLQFTNPLPADLNTETVILPRTLSVPLVSPSRAYARQRVREYWDIKD